MDSYPSPVNNNSSRKRNAEPGKWKRNLAKRQRYSAKTLPKRLMCTHKKTFKCMSLKMSDVKDFFESFYAQPDKQKQDAMLLKHCTPITVKRRRCTNSSKAKQRFQTKFYIYSKSENKKVQVCQRYFLTILQITKYRVQRIMKEYYDTGNLLTENRGGDRVSMKYTAKREAIMSFINKIPCEEPHYCRGNTKRYYLSSELSINKLWKMYNSEAVDDLKVKKSYFRRIFNTKYNLSFGTPRTDVCATCLRFSEEMKREKDDKVRVDLMTAQRVHKLKAKAFFEKVKEENTDFITFSFDCEKNLNLLKVPDQVAYYLRNVYLYNFTITVGSSKSKLLPENVFAYCWTEEKYPKAANEIASELYHRLQNTDFSTVTKVRLISDGCAGQNKNTIMLAMLSKWLTEAPQNVKEVEFVFPVVGHSYIPPDRVFAQIEKEVRKHEVINGPQKYLEVISGFSTVNKLGAECEVLDWKTASQEVFKPVGSDDEMSDEDGEEDMAQQPLLVPRATRIFMSEKN
ncbi:uncharacterized protein LOC121740540 [Aricia agestis]|uniref:uncharacterized protein LOC121740540 n=1 Tax=Aricia agestis TaxID=91739 RepID=UPI001C204F60|nr:uncharacterized protein LOC121740540 [Aricia agestis]